MHSLKKLKYSNWDRISFNYVEINCVINIILYRFVLLLIIFMYIDREFRKIF